jgi:H+/Cl- antiporter ClcA
VKKTLGIGRIMHHDELLGSGQTCSGERRSRSNKDQDTQTGFTILGAVFGLLSILLFYADVLTDILLAKDYFNQGNKLAFGLTASFVVVPSIITCFVNFRWYVLDHQKSCKNKSGVGTSTLLWVTRFTVTLLMMGPVIRYI